MAAASPAASEAVSQRLSEGRPGFCARSLIGSFVNLDVLCAFLRANDGNKLQKCRLFGGDWHGGLLQHLFDCGQLQGLQVRSVVCNSSVDGAYLATPAPSFCCNSTWRRHCYLLRKQLGFHSDLSDRRHHPAGAVSGLSCGGRHGPGSLSVAVHPATAAAAGHRVTAVHGHAAGDDQPVGSEGALRRWRSLVRLRQALSHIMHRDQRRSRSHRHAHLCFYTCHARRQEHVLAAGSSVVTPDALKTLPISRRDVYDFLALLDELPQLDTVLLQRVRVDGHDYDTTFAGYNHDVVR